METKICRRCNKELPLKDFENKNNIICKACNNCRAKEKIKNKKQRDKIVITDTNKICRICKISRPIEEFNGKKACKKCLNKEKIYREEHKKNIKASRDKYIKNNPEKNAESKRKYSKNNRDKERKKLQRWRKNNPMSYLRYRTTPKGRVAHINALTKRRYLIDDARITPEEWVEVMNSTGWTCIYCGAKLTDENRCLDHFVPLVLGGKHRKSNVVPACKSCNSSKGGKLFSSWPNASNIPEEKYQLLLQKEKEEMERE